MTAGMTILKKRQGLSDPGAFLIFKFHLNRVAKKETCPPLEDWAKKLC